MSKNKGCHSKPKGIKSNEAFLRLIAKKAIKMILAHFLGDIRNYERESGNLICYDDRTDEELVDIYIEKYLGNKND